jgi:hypothetical protein
LSRKTVIGEEKSENFHTEIVSLENQKVSLVTKNNDGRILSVVSVRPTIMEVLGNDYDFMESFNKKSKGRNSFAKSI